MPPRPGTTCTVCRHLSREQIDARIIQGIGMDTISVEFGVHRDAVMRHRRNHLSPALQALRGEVVEAKGQALLDRVERQIGRIERVAIAGEKQGSARVVLDATREMRGMLELLGKVSGELKDGPQVAVNLIASPDWVALRRTIFDVLEAYPEARAALASRLLHLEGGRES